MEEVHPDYLKSLDVMGCFKWPIIAGLMVIHWKVSFQICTSGGLSSWWWNSDRISSTSYTKCLRVCGLLPIQSMCVLWIWSKCPHLSLPPGKMGSWASYWESSSLCLPEYRAWFVLSGISQTWSLLVLDYSRNVLWQALVTTICMDRISRFNEEPEEVSFGDNRISSFFFAMLYQVYPTRALIVHWGSVSWRP